MRLAKCRQLMADGVTIYYPATCVIDVDVEVEPDAVIEKIVAGLRTIHKPSHATAKKRLRQATMDAMRAAIDRELTMEAYQANSRARSAVVLPKRA